MATKGYPRHAPRGSSIAAAALIGTLLLAITPAHAAEGKAVPGVSPIAIGSVPPYIPPKLIVSERSDVPIIEDTSFDVPDAVGDLPPIDNAPTGSVTQEELGD